MYKRVTFERGDVRFSGTLDFRMHTFGIGVKFRYYHYGFGLCEIEGNVVLGPLYLYGAIEYDKRRTH